MDTSGFYTATLINLGINLTYSILALVVVVIAFVLVDRYLFRQIDFIEEIKKGNIAAAIFASTLLIFLAVVIGFAMHS